MKDLYDIYNEGLLDDDETAIRMGHQHMLSDETIRELLKGVSDDLGRSSFNPNYIVNEDRSVTISKDVTFKKNIPELITIKDFTDDVKTVTFLSKDVTSIAGLPSDMRKVNIEVIATKIENFEGAPKMCNYLKVDTCYDLKSLKGIPNARNIRFKDVKKSDYITAEKWTVKEIAKYSKTKQSNIVVL